MRENFRMKRAFLAFLLLCVASPAFAQGELIENGNFLDSPDLAKFPGVENHAGAWILRLPAGFQQLGHWAVSGSGGALSVWKRRGSSRTLQLNNGASVSQTIPTLPHHAYDVRIEYGGDGEGARNQKIDVRFGNEHRPVVWNLDTKRQDYKPFDEIFTADSTGTVLQLTGMNRDGSSMFIWKISATEVTAKAAATGGGPIEERYREIDGWASHADIPEDAASRLSDDFAGKSKEGDTWNRAGYLGYWHHLYEGHLSVSSVPSKVTPDDAGATVLVDRHIWGTGTNRVTHWKDVWVKDGERWLLKSSEQI